jgi:hypothetical protein
MHPNYYGNPLHHYGRFRRGPSRILWFLLGGAAFAIWNHSHQLEPERRRFAWCRDRLTGRDDRDRVDHATEARRGRRGETSAMATQTSAIEAGFTKEDARTDDNWESEPLWKLRSEKEAERRRTVRDIEVREQLLNAREKVCASNYFVSWPC